MLWSRRCCDTFEAAWAESSENMVPLMRAPRKLLLLGLLLVSALGGWAQTSASRANQQLDQQPDSDSIKAGANWFPEPAVNPANRLFLPFLKHIADDQRPFWSSPKELHRPAALRTFLPFAGLTGALIASDCSIANRVPGNQLQRSRDVSNYAVFSLVGGAAGSYALGQLAHNDHLRETGFLSSEAALNSTLIMYALKEATMRQRPYEGNGRGSFWQGGASFPSGHAALAWSVASIVAHEYPGPLTKLITYGLASTATLTRVTGKQHFPSDVVVGSALGWHLGRQVYHARHDPELGGALWGNLRNDTEKGPRPPGRMGSA